MAGLSTTKNATELEELKTVGLRRFSLMVVFGLSIASVALVSKGVVADSLGVKIFEEQANSAVDTPSGRLVLRIPASSSTDMEDVLVPGSEGAQPPSEPNGPGVENEDPPIFQGEEVSDYVVFVLDVSYSMVAKDLLGAPEDYEGNVDSGATRLDAVKYETVSMLQEFSESQHFEFILLAGADKNLPGGPTKPVTDVWRGELVQATPENVDAAIEYVKNMSVWWGTPTYPALKRACHEYGKDLQQIVFLTDGAPFPPNAYGPGPTGHKDAILNDFPKWFSSLRANGCRLTCFQIGQDPSAGSFMEEFAAANNTTLLRW